jgi:hypothetical protein
MEVQSAACKNASTLDLALLYGGWQTKAVQRF